MRTAFDLVAALAVDCVRAAPNGSAVYLAVPQPLHGMLLADRQTHHQMLLDGKGGRVLCGCRILASYDQEFHAHAEHKGERLDLDFEVDPVVRLLIEAGVSWP